MNSKLIKVLCVAGLAASMSMFTTGCGKKAVQIEDDPAASQSAAVADDSAAADTGDTAGAYESISSEDPVAAAAGTVYAIAEGRTHEGLLPAYFDFDQFVIRADQKSRLEGNVVFLQANPAMNLVIEGNCDERGTNEYNVALGERRARSAQKYMTDLGIDASRLTTVSYGEEKPLLYGHDEYSWSQNRRDDFVIQ